MSTSGGVPAFAYPLIAPPAGTAFEPLPGGATGAVNNIVNLAIYVPFLLSADVPIHQLGVSVTAAPVTTDTARLGVYRDNGAGRPGDVAIDAGPVGITAVGDVFVTLDQDVTLVPGWYWSAVATIGGAAGDFALTAYSHSPGSWPLPAGSAGIRNTAASAVQNIYYWDNTMADVPFADNPSVGTHVTSAWRLLLVAG